MKDADLEPGVLALVKGLLREMAESGRVRRVSEGGRLWDWWGVIEEGFAGRAGVIVGGSGSRSGSGSSGMEMEGLGEAMGGSGFGF